MAIFLNTDISQGSVATRLGFPTESNSERILKIGQYLVKLWARVRYLVFFDSQCKCSVMFMAKRLTSAKLASFVPK